MEADAACNKETQGMAALLPSRLILNYGHDYSIPPPE
jgi:hypothetical protein